MNVWIETGSPLLRAFTCARAMASACEPDANAEQLVIRDRSKKKDLKLRALRIHPVYVQFQAPNLAIDNLKSSNQK